MPLNVFRQLLNLFLQLLFMAFAKNTLTGTVSYLNILLWMIFADGYEPDTFWQASSHRIQVVYYFNVFHASSF